MHRHGAADDGVGEGVVNHSWNQELRD
jgi:hypothetical protein